MLSNSSLSQIDFVNLLKDSSGKSRGICFINFKKPETAKLVIEQMNGFDLAGQTLRVCICEYIYNDTSGVQIQLLCNHIDIFTIVKGTHNIFLERKTYNGVFFGVSFIMCMCVICDKVGVGYIIFLIMVFFVLYTYNIPTGWMGK